MTLTDSPSPTRPTAWLRPSLADELPVFCEKCGYSLHGLPQARCERCDVLHFQCPECGHHQAINTLRPVFQRLIGRLSAMLTVVMLLFRVNFFGWLLFAWFAMGVEFAYYMPYEYAYTYSDRVPAERVFMLSSEALLAFGAFAVAFGFVGRMLLLRWRLSLGVGVVLAALVVTAIALGAMFRQWENHRPSPFNDSFLLLLGWTGVLAVLAAWVIWPIWVGLTNLFLRPAKAKAILAWMRDDADGSSLARPSPRSPAAAADTGEPGRI